MALLEYVAGNLGLVARKIRVQRVNIAHFNLNCELSLISIDFVFWFSETKLTYLYASTIHVHHVN